MLALSSFPFQFEIGAHLIDVVQSHKMPLVWALPLLPAHKQNALSFYQMLARNKSVDLSYMDFHVVSDKDLEDAHRIIVLTDDDVGVHNLLQTDCLKLQHKIIVLNHVSSSRFPFPVYQSIYLNRFAEADVSHTVTRQWMFPCSDLISPHVKHLENLHYIGKVVVGIVGTTYGHEDELRNMMGRIDAGTPGVQFNIISRIAVIPKFYEFTHVHITNELELFESVRYCTHILHTHNDKPTISTISLALSLLVPLVRPLQILDQETIPGIGYLSYATGPIELSLPTEEFLGNVASVRRRFISKSRAFYGLSDFCLDSIGVSPIDSIQSISPIPKIIHHMWLSFNPFMQHIPAHLSYTMAETMKDYPHHIHKIWTNDNILETLGEHFPHYVRWFHSISNMMIRADIAKSLVLLVHGGWYFDLELNLKNPMDTYSDVNLVLFGDDETQTISNGIMGASPNHGFLNQWLNHLLEKKMETNIETEFYQIWKSFGELDHLYPLDSIEPMNQRVLPSPTIISVPIPSPVVLPLPIGVPTSLDTIPLILDEDTHRIDPNGQTHQFSHSNPIFPEKLCSCGEKMNANVAAIENESSLPEWAYVLLSVTLFSFLVILVIWGMTTQSLRYQKKWTVTP